MVFLSHRSRLSIFCGFVFFTLLLSCVSPQCIEPSADNTCHQAQTAEFLPDVFSYRLPYRPQLDLNGEWEFRRDPAGIGKDLGWHRGDDVFSGRVIVPGAPQAQGHGAPHQYQKTMFMEPFWMRRTFEVPSIASDERLWLRVGGILPAAEIYVNGMAIGYTKSSRTQQRIDITQSIEPSATNFIAIKICGLPEVRMDGLLEWNEGTQKWMGAFRPIYCEIANRLSVIDVFALPDPASGTLKADITLSERASSKYTLVVRLKDGDKNIGRKRVSLLPGTQQISAGVKLKHVEVWCPENPKLYTLEIELRDSRFGDPIDRVGLNIGMKDIRAEGTKFFLNGKPVFLRCFGDDHYYPDTLCPPHDLDWYLPRLQTARAYGMNAVKACVEVIPQDYLEACDRAGIMVIQEMPFGLSTLRENRHKIDARFRDYYARELEGIVRVSRNHASVIAYSMSSELAYDSQTQESFDFFNGSGLPALSRQLAPHVLTIDCTGYVNSKETSKGMRNTDFYASVHPLWMKDILQETDFATDEKAPMILHEYNWWSNYPHPSDRAKYSDAQLKPFWLDTLLETAWANGQGELISLYNKNSLWLQALARKDGIEYARRNRLVEGYILWLLIDFGHWSEGLLDDFWNPKNVTPQEFMKSNGDTVILLAEEGNRCLSMGECPRIPLAISHYGSRNLNNSTLRWRIHRPDGIQEGDADIAEVHYGELTSAGTAKFELPIKNKAYKLELEVELTNDGERINTNNWSFWAFPAPDNEACLIADPKSAGRTIGDGIYLRLYASRKAPIPDGTKLVIAGTVDADLGDYIQKGGKCILFPQGAEIENTTVYYGQSSFYPIYRSIPWNAGSSGNSGTVISPHPSLEKFPNEGMCDLPFVPMMRGFLPMEFEPLRKYGVQPIIRGIDHYYSNRNNAYLMEFAVGEGKVLACSLGVLKQLKPDTTAQVNWDNPAAFIPNQTIQARYLLTCLLDYAQGGYFTPKAAVPRDDFLLLFKIRPDFVEKAESAGQRLM